MSGHSPLPNGSPHPAGPACPQAVPYVRACRLLKACATLLRMPPRALATALAYLHRWKAVVASGAVPELAGHDERSEDHILTACLFLASKVEEAATSNNHLLNVVHILRSLQHPQQQDQQQEQQQRPQLHGGVPEGRQHPHPEHPHPQQQPEQGECQQQQPQQEPQQQQEEEAPLPPLPPDPLALLQLAPGGGQERALAAAVRACGVLVGQDYYAAKQRLLDAEQLLLRVLRFELVVVQPHALVANAARCLRLAPGCQRLALCMLNDLWCFSDLCLLGGAEARATALAVLEAACVLAGCPAHVPSHAREAVPGLGWWQLLGVAEAEGLFVGGRVRGVLAALEGVHALAGGAG